MNRQWRMPDQGLSILHLWRRIRTSVHKNIDYSRDAIHGFPGTPPLKAAIAAFSYVAARHPNNIGVHTLGTQAEFGFQGTQGLEAELIYTVASLLGSDDPERKVDGYVCMGGSEGNDHGLWLGRNRLRACTCTEGDGAIAILSSFLTHYSLKKHFGRLFRSTGIPERPAPGDDLLQELPTNRYGELTREIVEYAIRRSHANGYRRFLLVLTAGTTNLGSVDRIREICESLPELKAELGIEAHVHVDAAFGGFVLPFTEPDCHFGFQNELVDSISADAHKMGYAPYSSGIFLCRKGLLRFTETPAGYIGGHFDHTVCGSRSGSNPAACWAAIHSLGKRGYLKKLEECYFLQEYLCDRLEEFNDGGSKRVELYPSRMNIQAVWFDEDLRTALQAKPPSGGPSLQEQFCIPMDMFPDLNCLRPDSVMIDRNITVFRFVTMPHLTREHIDSFIEALQAKLRA